MLSHGRIPHTEAEGEAIARLQAKHGEQATLTRRDRGDTGPLLVHIGEETWLVGEDGKTAKQRRAD